jgi:hypothetical protein
MKCRCGASAVFQDSERQHGAHEYADAWRQDHGKCLGCDGLDAKDAAKWRDAKPKLEKLLSFTYEMGMNGEVNYTTQTIYYGLSAALSESAGVGSD